VLKPAYEITARATVTFSSRADHPVFNPLISETLDAVTATPIFFPPVTLTGMADGLQGTGRSMPVPMQHAFIDGAVVSGAALLPAIAEARRLWPREDRLVVVVVGPGRPARSVVVPPGGMGGPQWLQVRTDRKRTWGGAGLQRGTNTALISHAVGAQFSQSDLVGIAMEAGLTDVQLRTILGPSVDLIRVSGINQSVSDDFDDTNVANIDALDALGRAWYLDCRAALIRLLVAQLDGGPQLGSAMASQAASPTFLTPSSLPALSPLTSSVPASVPSPAPLAPVAGAVPLASLSITTTGLAGAPAPEAPLPSAPAASSVRSGDAATAADVLASNSPQTINSEPMRGKPPSKATKAARAAGAEGTDKDKGKGKGKAAPKASTKGKKKDDSSDDEGDEEEEESSGKNEDEDEDEEEDSDEEEDEEDEVEEEDEDEDEEDEGDEDDAEGEEDEDDEEEEEERSEQGGNCVVS